jgi:DNA-binding HxlR family transcriptional regulator
MAPPPLIVLSPLHRAMRQVALHFEEALRDLPVSGIEGHVLSFLARYSPTSCGELTRVFGVKPSTLTSMLDRLAARGLLARRIDHGVRAFEGRLRARVSEADLRGFRAVLDAIAAETAVDVRAPEPRAPLED